MMSFKYPLSTLVILLTATWVHAKRDYSIELLEITTKVSDVDFFKFVNHSVTSAKVGNFHLLLDKNVTEWSMEMCFDVLTKGNRRMNFIKTEVNICQLAKSSNRNKFVASIMKEILRTSNVPLKCPFLEHLLYSIKNYTIKDDSYPPILPVAKWQFDMNSILNKIYGLNITTKGRIRKL